MKIRFIIILLIFSITIFTTCNDPVFYEVSMQVEKKNAIIKGSPTAFAEMNGYMFVASGEKLFYYDLSSENWKSINPRIGRITYLAATSTNLYLLTTNGVYRYTSDPISSSPTPILNSSYWFLSMYSANNQIYVGARRRSDNTYHIFNATSSLTPITLNTASSYQLLNGAAYNGSTTFLSVKDEKADGKGGIYSGSGSTFTLIEGKYNIPFMGIVRTKNSNVYAIERYSGDIYSVTSSTYTKTSYSSNRISNGMLYFDSETNILIAGRQETMEYNTSTCYTYGYMEAHTNSSSGEIEGSFREPGIRSPSTLPIGTGNNDRFKTTLGKYPIKFMHRSSDSNKTLFVSTSLEGVWSLRERDRAGSPYWNTED